MKQITASQQPSNYNKWRWGVFALAFVPWLLMVWRVVLQPTDTRGSLLVILITLVGLVAIAGVGAAMCYKTSRQFGRGEAARWVWMLISFFSIADGLIVITTWIPNLLPGRGLTTPLVLTSNTLAILARILTGCSFWMMIRIYRQSGFRLKLSKMLR
jgi:hypothetical protein